MFLKVCDTGSQANGYAIGNENEVLLVEAGCPFKQIKQMLNFRVDNIVGMCISHEHGDHFRYVDEYKRAGIPIYTPFREGEESLRARCKINMNGWRINEFTLPHGETVSFGFYIRHEEMGKLLFLTDCEYSPVSFKDLEVNHILVECNYQTDLLDMDIPNFEHKVRVHMSLETCKAFIDHNKSPELRTVTLIHSSPFSVDENDAVSQIKEIVDKDVEVRLAKAGLEIELNKEAF